MAPVAWPLPEYLFYDSDPVFEGETEASPRSASGRRSRAAGGQGTPQGIAEEHTSGGFFQWIKYEYIVYRVFEIVKCRLVVSSISS